MRFLRFLLVFYCVRFFRFLFRFWISVRLISLVRRFPMSLEISGFCWTSHASRLLMLRPSAYLECVRRFLQGHKSCIVASDGCAGETKLQIHTQMCGLFSFFKTVQPGLAPAKDGCLSSPQMDLEIKIEKDELPIAAINGLLPSSPTTGSSPGALAITRRGHRPTSAVKRNRAAPSKGSPRRRTVMGYLSKRRPVSLYERERAYEAAQSFTSKFPFFTVCMKVWSVYKVFLLMVPSSFAKAHLPRARTDLLLEDPAGRAWPVRYIPDPESKLSGGWFAFTIGNNLEEGDLCAFELVRPLELRVHIFRVVEEITPLVRICWPCSA